MKGCENEMQQFQNDRLWLINERLAEQIRQTDAFAWVGSSANAIHASSNGPV